MYAHIDAFAIDKAASAIYEGIALLKIQEWYSRQGRRIHARYNEANGLEQKRGYDLIDTLGIKWECKCDRLAGTTGNVFFEHQALERSGADMLIIFAAGLTFILSKADALLLKNSPYRVVQGGDGDWATGTLVPLTALTQYLL